MFSFSFVELFIQRFERLESGAWCGQFQRRTNCDTHAKR